jgi:hypothetical protein
MYSPEASIEPTSKELLSPHWYASPNTSDLDPYPGDGYRDAGNAGVRLVLIGLECLVGDLC